MKKRMLAALLALCLALSLGTAALAAEEPETTPEPEYRLVKVTSAYGYAWLDDIEETSADLTYGHGGCLPTEVLVELLSSGGQVKIMAVYDEAGRLTSVQESVPLGVGVPDLGGSATYVYDERGDLVETAGDGGCYEYEYTYDEDGNCIQEKRTGTDGALCEIAEMTEYIYDEAGNRARAERTYDYDYSVSPLEDVMEYIHDEDGSLRDDCTSYTSVIEYTYDEAGNCIREEETGTRSDGTAFTRTTDRTYGEDGRITTTIKTDKKEEASTSYAMPLLSASWTVCTEYASDGPYTSSSIFSVSIKDSAGENAVSFSCFCNGEPTLTYDDNGYLIKADDGAGNYIELTYEPVA